VTRLREKLFTFVLEWRGEAMIEMLASLKKVWSAFSIKDPSIANASDKPAGTTVSFPLFSGFLLPLFCLLLIYFICHIIIENESQIIAPAGISPRGEIPRRHPSNSRVY